MPILKGKVALITGVSRGIGAATALQMAKEGAAVIIKYNGSREAAEQVVAAVATAGGRAITLQADVSQEQEVIRLLRKVLLFPAGLTFW